MIVADRLPAKRGATTRARRWGVRSPVRFVGFDCGGPWIGAKRAGCSVGAEVCTASSTLSQPRRGPGHAQVNSTGSTPPRAVSGDFCPRRVHDILHLQAGTIRLRPRERSRKVISPVNLFGRKTQDSTDPLDTNCRRCKKQIGPGGMRGTALISGDALMELMETRAVYRCKSCGTPFCLGCMAELKANPCPSCRKSLGW